MKWAKFKGNEITYLVRWVFKFCMKNIDIKGGI